MYTECLSLSICASSFTSTLQMTYHDMSLICVYIHTWNIWTIRHLFFAFLMLPSLQAQLVIMGPCQAVKENQLGKVNRKKKPRTYC